MGQRLNLEITTSDKEMLNVYYHWSGFTESAIEIGLGLVKSKATTLKEIIEYLQIDGARVSDSKEAISELIELGIDVVLENVDRDNGLISVTDKAMRETRKWAEQTLVFNFLNDRFWGDEILWKETNVSTIIEHHEKTKKLDKLYGNIEGFEKWIDDISTESHLIIVNDEMYCWVE